jgi:hypothetical protein
MLQHDQARAAAGPDDDEFDELGRFSGTRADSPGISDLAGSFDGGDIDAVSAYLKAAR